MQRKGILVPVSGHISNFVYSDDDAIFSFLDTSVLKKHRCHEMEIWDYHLTCYSDEDFIKKKLLPNPLGSLITKAGIYGTCILVDDSLDLTIDDFEILITLAEVSDRAFEDYLKLEEYILPNCANIAANRIVNRFYGTFFHQYIAPWILDLDAP